MVCSSANTWPIFGKWGSTILIVTSCLTLSMPYFTSGGHFSDFLITAPKKHLLLNPTLIDFYLFYIHLDSHILYTSVERPTFGEYFLVLLSRSGFYNPSLAVMQNPNTPHFLNHP